MFQVGCNCNIVGNNGKIVPGRKKFRQFQGGRSRIQRNGIPVFDEFYSILGNPLFFCVFLRELKIRGWLISGFA